MCTCEKPDDRPKSGGPLGYLWPASRGRGYVGEGVTRAENSADRVRDKAEGGNEEHDNEEEEDERERKKQIH